MRIVFMGTPAAAARSLQMLIGDGHDIAGVYTQPDRPSGRGNKVAFSPVKELAIEHGLPLYQPAKIRTPGAVKEFRSLAADIAVVVAYGRILPDGFLTAFPKGAVNVHFSLLPKYRGAAPVNWAIVNGETVTGVTTIRMDTGLDTGDVFLAREVSIGDAETAPELMDRLSQVGAEVLRETLENIDSLVPTPQNNEAASFAPIMKRGDGLIDWAQPADAIARRVRGFQPFPGSYTFLGARKVTMWAARPEAPSDGSSSDLPGTVMPATRRKLLVAAGSGTRLEIEEIQFEGKKRMRVMDALNGSLVRAGDRFTAGNEEGSADE